MLNCYHKIGVRRGGGGGDGITKYIILFVKEPGVLHTVTFIPISEEIT